MIYNFHILIESFHGWLAFYLFLLVLLQRPDKDCRRFPDWSALKAVDWYRAKHSFHTFSVSLTKPNQNWSQSGWQNADLQHATAAARDHNFLDPIWRRRSAGSHMHCNSSLSWGTGFDIITSLWPDIQDIAFQSYCAACWIVVLQSPGSANLAAHDAGHRQEGITDAHFHQGLLLLPLQESWGA